MPRISSKQLHALYKRAVAACRKEPNEEEFAAWENVLLSFQAADIEAAIRTWQNDAELEEFSGRPRGARMPMAVELKAWIQRRDRAAASTNFIPCSQCEDGWVRVFRGVTVRAEGYWGGGKPIDSKVGAVRRCQCWHEYIAGHKWGIVQRRNAGGETGNVIQM
jgi:hypothetical protein